MEKTVRLCALLLFGLLFFQSYGQSAKNEQNGVKLFSAWQDKYAGAKDFTGTFRWEKRGGTPVAGTFIIKGERFRLVLPDKEITGDGTYIWEVTHRDARVKRRHYDAYEAPAMLFLSRLVRLDITSDYVSLAGNGTDVTIEIETGMSVAQGKHVLSIDPVKMEPVSIVLHENQGDYLERAEIGQFAVNQGFADETFTVDIDSFKKKGYTLLDMAKGENLTVLPEEKALLPQ